MLHSMNHPPLQETPLLYSTSTTPSTSGRTSSSSNDDVSNENPPNSFRYQFQNPNFKIPISLSTNSYKSLAVLSDHIGPVTCLALCGEFILSASHGNDIIVWQQPLMKRFTKFGKGEGSVKSLIVAGDKILTAHQDSKIRVWKVSRSSENVFRLLDTLPTTRDYLGKFMKQSNYIQTRRNHQRLWIEHVDTISCLAVSNGLIYSGSWDKTLKVWSLSDFKCLESMDAHDDAINELVAINGVVYSSSSDGTIKVWGREGRGKAHCLKGVLEGHRDISVNALVVSDDGRLVYGGGSDGFVMGWVGNRNRDGWRSVCEVRAHGMSVLCMCLMGGGLLCSGSADRSICVWKREMNGGLFRHMVIKGHQGPVKCLQALPMRLGAGFLLYSGSLDKSLRVWWVPTDSSS